VSYRLPSSFAVRLLLALVGVVILFAGTLLIAVGRQTGEQVRVVTARAARISSLAFGEVEELHRAQVARLARAFTDSRRTLAALEAALESGERDWLIDIARYELELARLDATVAAFTDARGNVVATLVDGEPVNGDPAGVAALSRAALEQDSARVLAYRVIDGRLLALSLERIELAGRAIGTVTSGVPVDADVAAHLSQAAGVEVCFTVDGSCIGGTAVAGSSLGALMAAHANRDDAAAVTHEGQRWVLVADDVAPGATPRVHRVIAVPVDDALAPFEHIRAVAFWAGLVALLLAIGAGVLLAHRLARPVRELVDATDRIARGDLATRVTVRGRDELGALGRSFNAMVEGLALKERYRDVLQKVVSRDVAEDLVAGQLQLGGETRTVTVLFADIVGFATIAEDRDPRVVINILNECMSVWSRIIEEECGVVDKYTGDGVMAIFGAPVAHADDATRAVRAARRMQDAARRMNASRPAPLPRVHLAIGINTGPAVAGNVGSPDRLNYTVIGESVNLAARLCTTAGASEILISESTMRTLEQDIHVIACGERRVKGLSRPVPVYSVVDSSAGLPADAPADREPAAGTSLLRTVLLAGVLLAAIGAPAGAAAQERGRGLPTLAGLGLSWISASGAFQLDLSGRLDVEGYLPQDSPAWLIPSVDPFVAGRLRLFADIFAGRHVYGLLELRADRGEAPAPGAVEARLEQAFLRITPSARANLSVQAGKFTLPFGGYTERHHTIDDPLIRPPIAYDYRTVMSPHAIPAATDGFLNWKNTVHVRRPRGAPQVWNVPYPWGAMVTARWGALATRAAALSASPSSAPEEWDLDTDRLRHPTLVGGATVQVLPELRIGLAHARGPWLGPIEEGTLPAGTHATDFLQKIWNAELVFARGRTTMRSELFIDSWEVPNLQDDPGDVSWYLESSWKAAAGLIIAARWSEIRFQHLDGDTTAGPWDHDVRRLQLGAGYRILHNTGIRVEYLRGWTRGIDPRDDLVSVQVWWDF